MRIFKNEWFRHFAKRERINDSTLKDAITRAERGLIDADLGGGVIKQRIARAGQGKSGGYRSIIFFRRGEYALFAYGFAKSDRANVYPDEVAEFKKIAKGFFLLTDKQIESMLIEEELTEIL